MWLRYFFLSGLKWFVQYFVVSFLTIFAVPIGLSGYLLSVPLWLVTFFIAFIFAEWVYSNHLPNNKNTAILIVIWMAVSLMLYIFLAYFILGSINYVINSIDIYVQLLLEVIAILLATKMIRKNRLSKVLSEGMEV